MTYLEKIRNAFFMAGFQLRMKAKPEKLYTYADFKLWQRELIFAYLHQHMDHDHSQYAILWEDPNDPDAPAKVTHPTPIWLAMAKCGSILPPVEVYHALAEDEAKPDFRSHTRGHLLHDTPPIGPMTEEEAIEYLIQMALPPSVWRDYKGNRIILRTVERSSVVEQNRENRNAWRVNQETEQWATL